MAQGDLVLVPVVLQANSAEELAEKVVLERIKRKQSHAVAHYTSHWVSRTTGNGYTKYTAFLEISVEEK